jgi:DNA-binding transcriptional MerR regulator
MSDEYSLSDLAEAVGIEERTIRSYIERGLLPGATARGRGASYTVEHLSRLRVIRCLRRARPDVTLSEIRIALQSLTPQQVHDLAAGSITAATRQIDESPHPDENDADELAGDEMADDNEATPLQIDWEQCAAKLTGVERLVRLLRDVSGFGGSMTASKVEQWQRIAITPDVELAVRADFDGNQLIAFRELAGLLRHLLQRTDALSRKGDE